MKFIWAVSLCLLCAMASPEQATAANSSNEWRAVNEAIDKGLPRTAITNLESILSRALKAGLHAEAVRALGERIALEGQLEAGKPEARITRMESEITNAPPQMRPLLQTLLAHWYWAYYSENQWRFRQRTATAQAPGADITTWDLPRIYQEVGQHFDAALAAEATLKAEPIQNWNDLLRGGALPDAYRPTLYDFIAHEALGFYTKGHLPLSQPQDAFKVSADSPALADTQAFLAWEPRNATNTPPSPEFHAAQLFQALLRFHKNDPTPSLAFAHVDLERLSWAWNVAQGPAKDSRYKAALREYIRTYQTNEISALASERLASMLQREDDLTAAHAEATKAATAFPNSPGGKLCRNLISSIEAKSVEIKTERVWNAPWPDITVQYRNINKVHFKAIAVNWEEFLDRRRSRPENLNQDQRREIVSRPSVLTWSTNLPPTTNFKLREFDIPAPSKLRPGFYFITASVSAGFEEEANNVSIAAVWVSDLALITRPQNGSVEGFVLNAISGEPVSGAQIDSWHLSGNGLRVQQSAVRTDANGLFSIPQQQQRQRGFLLRARHHGHEIATQEDVGGYFNPQEAVPVTTRSVLFTDRSLYRPGQTIQYKGVSLLADQERDVYEVLKGERVTVVLRDRNGQELARQPRQANDYGSFSGSFTAPSGSVMGQLTLLVEGRAAGTASVRVEEYKRPKFEVTLNAPTKAPKLGENVQLTGKAATYTAAPVDNAQVTYRVTRESHMPWWWGGFWRGGLWPASDPQEIAHGTLKTGSDGNFNIAFQATPDLGISPTNEPSFHFRVTVDVTDSAGETRSSSRAVRVGYTAMEARLAANGWQTASKPVHVIVTTTTLDAEPEQASGILTIHALQAPDAVVRPPLEGFSPRPRRGSSRRTRPNEQEPDLSNPATWPLGTVLTEKAFTTGTNGQADLEFALQPGVYRAVLKSQDRFGKPVRGEMQITVLAPEDAKLAIKVPQLLTAPKWELQPGDEFMAVWGTGYGTGRAFIEVEHRGKMLQRFWTKPGRTQQQVKLKVSEAMRGGFILHVTQVRENRLLTKSPHISVPWKNKELELRWERFVSKLEPGQKETWSLSIHPASTNSTATNADPARVIAELAATLYDASLDAFYPHDWQQKFDVFRADSSRWSATFANSPAQFQYAFGRWPDLVNLPVDLSNRTFPDVLARSFDPMSARSDGRTRFSRLAFGELSSPAMSLGMEVLSAAAPANTARRSGLAPTAKAALADNAADSAAASPPAQSQPLENISARKNLSETAFFFPQLTADSNGVARMAFTMPEALTRWRFIGFAHDRQLRAGALRGEAVTAREFMVQPNPPRFLREGDTVEFTVKILNQSAQPQRGNARLEFTFPATGASAQAMLGNGPATQPFDIPPMESRSLSWRITAPDNADFLAYKAVAATDRQSDGEEGPLPVLSRRILVTESLPLPIRGANTRTFTMEKLLSSTNSDTLRHQSLTAQMVSNPAWYAVLALPYLMEFPHECSEQVFNRFYANSLARNIATSQPRIRRIFDLWKNTPALNSPLEKNQDLKSVLIQETPWLAEARSESEARRNIGILFDENRLATETQQTLQKLEQMQLPEGAWPWFPGGQANEYITLYVVTGFGRLRHMNVPVRIDPALRALSHLDQWLAERHASILKGNAPEKYVPSYHDALYLYCRSFFLKDMPLQAEHRTAADFFITQARKHWLQTGSRQSQAHIALALLRFAKEYQVTDSTPADIMASLRERSSTTEEMGMFWAERQHSWWWHQAPIETQALMIEAFDEVAHDAKAVEDCRAWLLKQKQTQNWRTTKATADAVYALLLRGGDLLSDSALVQLKLGGLDLTPKVASAAQPSASGSAPASTNVNTSSGKGSMLDKRVSVEPGTGFYEVRFAGNEVRPEFGRIEVRKTTAGVAWGSVHWQYLEDISKITPHTNTPLTLKKSLYLKKNTNTGPVIEPVTGPLSPGDELVTRVELRVDRDMEYIHLKDQRGSGTEPVNVLSRYKYQDGLGYYESTRDTASHFFIDRLPAGVYVFEYSSRVQLRGEYQSGIAAIECMYAPEFNSHSASTLIEVK